MQPGQLGLARIKVNSKLLWYPAKLVNMELPKPVAPLGEYRTEVSLKVTYHVQLPFRDEKKPRALHSESFLPSWDSKFDSTPVRVFAV